MTQTSKEYALALFTLAKENGSEDETLSALKLIGEVFRKNPDYIEFASSPGIPKNERLDALQNAFSDSAPEYVMSFVLLLCERSRLRAFDSCVKEYEQLYDASKQICKAQITSAVELTEKQKQRLKTKLEKISGKSLILSCVTDSGILGGIIVEIDGNIVDGSLKRRLQDVKDVIDG